MNDVGEVRCEARQRWEWMADGSWVKRPPRDGCVLKWSDGTRAKAEGRDFESVIARLPADRLAYWYRVFNKRRTMWCELKLLEAEMRRRGVSLRSSDVEGQKLLFPEAQA